MPSPPQQHPLHPLPYISQCVVGLPNASLTQVPPAVHLSQDPQISSVLSSSATQLPFPCPICSASGSLPCTLLFNLSLRCLLPTLCSLPKAGLGADSWLVALPLQPQCLAWRPGACPGRRGVEQGKPCWVQHAEHLTRWHAALQTYLQYHMAALIWMCPGSHSHLKVQKVTETFPRISSF